MQIEPQPVDTSPNLVKQDVRSKGRALKLVVLILGIFLFFKWWFLAEYTYYKNPTAQNLLLAIRPQLSYGNSLKARGELYCKHNLLKLNECYAVVISDADPEDLLKDRARLNSLVADFIKQEESKANDIKKLPFTVTRVDFVHEGQIVTSIDTN